MKKAIELLGLVLLTGVLITACTTIIPMDAECSCLFQTVEKETENKRTVLDGYNNPQYGGMYALAREARRRADEIMREREARGICKRMN